MTELKSFGSPPPAVINVVAAVMVLLAPNGRVPRDRSWAKAKLMMSKVDPFLDSLINYEKENIHPNIITALEPYLKVRICLELCILSIILLFNSISQIPSANFLKLNLSY